MTQHEKIADLLETVTLRCFASMLNPNAPVLPHLVGKDPITNRPINYTAWGELKTESNETN